MEQIEKLYQKLNEKNSEIEDFHQRNLILKICCGIFGGFIFIIIMIIIRKLLNTNCNTGTCRYRNGAKNRDTSYTDTGTDSYNTHDKATEKDSLCDDINTEGHREENHAIEQTLLQVPSMNAGADKSDCPTPGASDFFDRASKKSIGTCPWASDFLNFRICTGNENTVFRRM